MKAAMEIVESSTAAKSYGVSQLTVIGEKATSLFGYDSGRASIIQDLKDLAKEKPVFKEIEPDYAFEPDTNNQP